MKNWENALLRDADRRGIKRELRELMNRTMTPVQRQQIRGLGDEVELRWTCVEEEYYDTQKKSCTAFAVPRRDTAS